MSPCSIVRVVNSGLKGLIVFYFKDVPNDVSDKDLMIKMGDLCNLAGEDWEIEWLPDDGIPFGVCPVNWMSV